MPRKRNILGDKVVEGKTKIIYIDSTDPDTPDDFYHVIIRSKDDITAGNGKRHHVIKGKGAAATCTTCNVFHFLARHVDTHFVGRVGETDFRADNLTMIPLEVVVRNIAAGSYLKRYPDVAPNTVLQTPVVELYYKDDVGGDPMVIIDLFSGRVLFYDPNQPVAKGFLREQPLKKVKGLEFMVGEQLPPMPLWLEHMRAPKEEPDFRFLTTMVYTARKVNAVLRQRLLELGYTLVDLKIEFGYTIRGAIKLGDVIDNDSWRLRRGGPDGEELSKQRWYRDPPEITPEVLAACLRGYEEVADITSRLCER